MNMKKLISSVSALALAASAFAGLAVTANAETLYSQDYESATAADWTTGTGGRYTPVIIDTGSNKFLSVDQNTRYNNGATITSSSFGIAADKDYTLTFDAIICAGNNNAATYTIKGADNAAIVTMTTGARGSSWTINGATTADIGYYYGQGTTDANLDGYTWHSYKLTSYSGKFYLTIDGALDTTALSGVSSTGGLGTMSFASGRYFSNFAIDNIVVRDVEEDDLPSTPQGEFSVVYQTTDGATLTKTSSGSGDAGSAPVLSLADKADFTEDGQKYIYVSDDSDTVVIDADNVMTVIVTVRAAAKYDIDVVSNIDGETAPLTSLSIFEGDTGSYSYPKYLTDESAKVTAEVGEATYSKSIAPTESATEEVAYTAYDGTAYFVDHEAITSTATLGSPNYSGGTASRAVTDGVAAFTVAEAGTYDITVAASCRNTNNSSVFAVYKNAVADENLIFNDDVKGTSQNNILTQGIKTKTDVELEAGDVIIIQGDNGQTWVDYVLAVQTATAEPAKVKVTVADGDAEPAVTEIEAGAAFTLPEAAGKEGYTFDGWSDGENTVPAGTVVNPEADVTYTAVYTLIPVVVDPTIGEIESASYAEPGSNFVKTFKAAVTAGSYAVDTFVWTAKNAAGAAAADTVSFSLDAGSTVVIGLIVETEQQSEDYLNGITATLEVR